jgi:hypothetical protein
MAVNVQIVVLNIVILYSIVSGYQCLGGTWCFHLRGPFEWSEDAVRLYRHSVWKVGHSGGDGVQPGSIGTVMQNWESTILDTHLKEINQYDDVM